MNKNSLQAAIVERGMNQSKLAAAIGISANALSRKINGKREFTIAEVAAIARVLKLENLQEIWGQ